MQTLQVTTFANKNRNYFYISLITLRIVGPVIPWFTRHTTNNHYHYIEVHVERIEIL